MGAARRALGLLGREIGGYAPGHRTRGEVKEDRDLVLHALWEMGVFGNEELGRAFGVSYSAVSHIVRDVRDHIKGDPRITSKAESINSQCKM